MSGIDAAAIRRFAKNPDRLGRVKVFAEIDSTNSYLMQMPGPEAGQLSVAVTNNQTDGRGRLGKTWQSPPGSGLCLSVAYTFRRQPDNLPALTLALGLGAIDALEELGARGVEVKWPNDLVALEGKLAGILTEVQAQSAGAVTVVAGIGVNIDLANKADLEMESDWARQVVDLRSICDVKPGHDEVAGHLVMHFLRALVEFEASGFATTAERWSRHDWLLGRDIIVDSAQRQYSGAGAGIAHDGALLVDTPEAGIQRVTSGSVVIAGSRGERQ